MIVELPEELTIAQAVPLKARLLAAIAGATGQEQRQEELLLDARRVTVVDVAGLQLLIGAWESAAGRGRKLGFAKGARSKVLDEAASAAGLIRQASAPALPTDPWVEVRHG
jgi:ABC-type transporter Mla MlaB component